MKCALFRSVPTLSNTGSQRDEPTPLTDSVINIFQGVENTASAVLHRVSCGTLSFDGIHKDYECTAESIRTNTQPLAEAVLAMMQ